MKFDTGEFYLIFVNALKFWLRSDSIVADYRLDNQATMVQSQL
jgi:hypothetical protein